jgi:hypothetical protein
MAKTNQKETNSNIVQQAFDNIAADVFESLIPEQKQRQIFGQTLQLLANGCAVPPDEIAIRLQVPPDTVISILRGFGGVAGIVYCYSEPVACQPSRYSASNPARRSGEDDALS